MSTVKTALPSRRIPNAVKRLIDHARQNPDAYAENALRLRKLYSEEERASQVKRRP